MSRHGVRIGVDVGAVRVGLAASDPQGLMATPVDTLRRDVEGGSDLTRIAAEVCERDALEVVVGLPLSMSGREGPAAATARAYAGLLAERLAVPVRLVDERLSTVAAHRSLHGAGVASRKHRAVVDQVAAVVLLQAALDGEAATGVPAGVLVERVAFRGGNDGSAAQAAPRRPEAPAAMTQPDVSEPDA